MTVLHPNHEEVKLEINKKGQLEKLKSFENRHFENCEIVRLRKLVFMYAKDNRNKIQDINCVECR